jgi:hypothetical protein
MPDSIRLRLFLSCWLVYVLHFATDVAREHYLVMSIVEDHSYRLDKYYGMHADIFLNPPNARVQGAHHGANPGISMVAVLPYFVFRPAVDFIVKRELATRPAGGDTNVVYRDERTRRVEFYRRIRREGLDLRFGLVSAITLLFCMAPLTAASAVLMYLVLGALGIGRRAALGLAAVYAFATPVFFRTAYLNQNLGLGIFAFTAFVLLWNPSGMVSWPARRRALLAGLLGGLCFLCDYSGAILMGLLGLYVWWREADAEGFAGGFRKALWYAAGTVPGILLLWQYQWASFGNPFLPPQNWMAPVEGIDVGYQGVGGFSPELLKMLLVDPRFGLLLAMPMSILALGSPWLARRRKSPLPFREAIFCLTVAAALIIFYSTVQYTTLQWVSGIRYLSALFPFLFLAAVPMLLRLPKLLVYALVLGSLVISWSMAMVRDQGPILRNIERVFVEGFQLPWLTVVGKMSPQYVPWLKGQVSPLPLFVLAGAVLWLIWRVRRPGEALRSAD